MDGPWLLLVFVVFQLHTIADVLFTGGRPIAAISALLFLASGAYFASRPRETADAHRSR